MSMLIHACVAVALLVVGILVGFFIASLGYAKAFAKILRDAAEKSIPIETADEVFHVWKEE